MISASEARNTILSRVPVLESVTVGIGHAQHAVLARDIVARENVPAFDNAQMDGYAVRSADVLEVPAKLHVIGDIPAGTVAAQPLGPGKTMRIMTGAKIPEGCDAVVQQEWVRTEGENAVTILRAVSRGHNIRNSGADIREGTVAVARGRQLRPQELGVIASLGEEFVTVVRRPSVAILPTGSEITALGKPLKTGRVRNSNVYTLSALVRELECRPKQIETAADEKEDLRSKILKGIHEDVLVTTGGVSVGAYDLVKDVLEEIGAEILIWKVNIKPGMPFLFGWYREKPVFGLPGNPVSAMITFLQFVRPAIEKMMGLSSDSRPIRRATMTHEFIKKDGKRHYLRGIVEYRNDEAVVRTIGPQVSNAMSSLALANCLIIVPEEKEIIRKGEEVEIELI